ncbi:ATP-binding protein [Candidatus Pacearchaeota archaeon]|nr:ATP-binding protein [Candidatus Pacearchaeota archaeon]
MANFCEKHNIEKQVFKSGLLSHPVEICPKCVEEKEDKDSQTLQDITIKSKAKKNANLDNAMIAPRFRDKILANFEDSSPGHNKAIKTANWFLNNLDDTTGLIMIGNPGTGKNHLASAIITEAVQAHNKTALFTETLKVIRAIKESWRREGAVESEVLKSFVEPDILVIDEIGVQFGSDTERMYLTEIINDRYNYKKPTILLGNVKIEELSSIIGERPLDRFREGGKVIIFDWDSYRKKG